METVREMIARIDAEMASVCGWIEIEHVDEGASLASGRLTCQAEAVEFEDDAGFRVRVPYASVSAVRFGRQGEESMLGMIPAPRSVIPFRAVG
ncbi:hypothetical protein OSH08_16375 [Kaistia geumhonensis]|uniref:Uncharacterized protein n=1 Tax=Kaistia geumhonensis TaxID=410839 RepID=A0ABU0M9R5_9HYPH|nr:hypothetical protein [Kaistia geumhonensis]MCX5480580.1 hypothetical protein [Kaistia geumhonensis]MDQ0517718.1 hypothetical protein [Kaistia geumhonensis]